MSGIGPAPPLDVEAMDQARQHWAGRAMPPGALGRLQELAVHLAGVTGRCPPAVPSRPAIALFAGDHGVVADGASAWPSAITTAMVETIAGGGAAINAIARSIGAEVAVVDVGVAGELPATAGAVVDRRIRSGTASIAREPAMSVDEAGRAVGVGRELAERLVADGADCLIGGEMGIGNTTPSAALIAVCTGRDPATLVGPGAGRPPGGLAAKRRLVEAAIARSGLTGRPADVDPIDLLAQVGGLEIAALAGFHLGAAHLRVPFVVDGVIAAAALCVADRLSPGAAARAVAGHRSAEPAGDAALSHLGLVPRRDRELRLGEGSGAALAFPVVAAAARVLGELAPLPRPGGGEG